MPEKDPVSRAVADLAERRDLGAALAEEAFSWVMAGEASPVLMSALLTGLRVKGETADEVVGAVRALRGAMKPVPLPDGATAVDTCGTGGGRLTTFNISTAAALVVAGAGVHVAKHGNRSFTSQSGSADVLEALGMKLPQTPEHAAGLLARCRMTFLFAPLFHPAMRHVGPVRRELGITTMMNLLGPLANPAGVRRQVVGVADEARAPLIALALSRLGTELAFVVHARVGMDEISPEGPTDVWEVQGCEVKQWTLNPGSLGRSGTLDGLRGGTPAENAAMIRGILAGTDRGERCVAVVLNAAAALVCAGLTNDWKEAADRAEDAIADGRAAAVLEGLVSTSE